MNVDANHATWQQKPLRATSVPDILTAAQCEAVKSDALAAAGFLERGALDETGTKKSRVRTSDAARLPRTPEREWLYELMVSRTIAMNAENWRFVLTDIEDIRVLRYRPFQRAKWHFDVYVGSPRKIVCIVNLSPPSAYWRGGLEVKGMHENKEIAGLQGAGTWFPTYLEHRALAPWYGERWSLAAVLTGPPWV